jgi:enterochelin esterase family protein
MKSLSALLALACVAPAFAQDRLSPQVLPNGRVTMRVKAPGARLVQLSWESQRDIVMDEDDQGVWSFTTAPLEPDYYHYVFVIDGVTHIDPNNPSIIHSLISSVSQVHVPGPASLPWEVNNVPHGVVHRHFYHSVAAGDDRSFYVYTPPNYKASGKRYPVLYLLHGFGGDASGWATVGQANVILDNLIARGQAKPMVVVMPLGYGTMEYVYAGQAHLRDASLRQRNDSQFRATLLDEVLPQVESAYHVSKNRKARAIAGLSMGGAQSLTIGLNNLDRFAWIGAFSSGGVSTNFPAVFPALDASANKRLSLLWISCGKDDSLFASNRNLVQWLEARDVHCTWREVPGTHSWRVWRRNLAAFAPLLFR